jgi:hypothetical protein
MIAQKRTTDSDAFKIGYRDGCDRRVAICSRRPDGLYQFAFAVQDMAGDAADHPIITELPTKEQIEDPSWGRDYAAGYEEGLKRAPLTPQNIRTLNPSRLAEFYVATTDDWAPNWQGNTVRVSVYLLTTGDIRLCVWGADDMGMERDETLPSDASKRDEWIGATLAFARSMPIPITAAWLKANGFIPA